MATIGLDKLFYSKITEDDNGNETYGTPQVLAKAMTADLSVELNEAVLYADDGAAEVVKEFKSGTLSLGVDDIGAAVAGDLTGSTIDLNGVVISASEDGGDPVAVGFRAKKSNGKYRYYWLYRVKFGIPATNLATKGDSITFSTPTIEGTIMRRNKVDAFGKHPWKAEVTEGTEGVDQSVIDGWYSEVYEPAGDLNLNPINLPGGLDS
jgi:phi13 family phage major tail protein|nr:MAG TPA: tail tube protein [Caudoviricetes sp.]